MIINILCDNKHSWFWKYKEDLINELLEKDFQINLCNHEDDLIPADIAAFISCIRLVSSEGLSKSKSNIVCHPSDLPSGKGSSPIAWEIIGGNNELTFTLFEAIEGVDSGQVYSKKKVNLIGDELNDEIKKIQAEITFAMIIDYIKSYPNYESYPQSGKESFYKRRTPADCELDINKSIKEQFDLLRTVDNENYPAFFNFRDNKYILKIKKDN